MSYPSTHFFDQQCGLESISSVDVLTIDDIDTISSPYGTTTGSDDFNSSTDSITQHSDESMDEPDNADMNEKIDKIETQKIENFPKLSRNVSKLKNKFIPLFTTLYFLSIGFNIFFWWFILMFPFLLLGCLPFTLPRIRQISQTIIRCLVGICMYHATIGLERICGITVHSYGDVKELIRSENSILLMNHPTMFDFLFLFSFMAKYSTLNRLKIMPKASLSRVPYLGWVMQLSMYVFLVRDWSHDRDNFLDLLSYYRQHIQRYQILMFPEGTTLGNHSIPRSDSYVEQQQMKPLYETNTVRTLGFIEMFFNLTRLNKLLPPFPLCVPIDQIEYNNDDVLQYLNQFTDVDAIYNLTIVYQNTREVKSNTIFLGSCAHHVHIHVKRYEIVKLVKEILNYDLLESPQYFLNKKASKTHLLNVTKKLYALHNERNLIQQNGSLLRRMQSQQNKTLSNSDKAEMSSKGNEENNNNYNHHDVSNNAENNNSQNDDDQFSLSTYNLKLSKRAILEQQLSTWLTNEWYEKDSKLKAYYDTLEREAKLDPENYTSERSKFVNFSPNDYIADKTTYLWYHRYSLLITLWVVFVGLVVSYNNPFFFKCLLYYNINSLFVLTLFNLPVHLIQLNSAKLFDSWTNDEFNNIKMFERGLTGTLSDVNKVKEVISKGDKRMLGDSTIPQRYFRLQEIQEEKNRIEAEKAEKKTNQTISRARKKST